MKKAIILLFLTGIVSAFPFEKRLNSIRIIDQNGEPLNLFSGAFNNPEHQFVDIDNDDDYDLFILNSDGYYSFLRNEGTSANPDFTEELFPAGLEFFNWFFFCDIDADGTKDCLTGASNNYVRIFRGNNSGGEISFTLLSDTLLTSGSNPLISESVSNPALVDIDDDGDLDFFITDQSGSILFYENTGSPENYEFTFVTDSWQDILIVGGGKSGKHGAASIEFCDIDGDNDFDLFWGDFFSGSLYFIRNNGSNAVADMELVSDFYPPEKPVNTSGFNMPRFVDIDNDNDFDLFVSVLYDPTVLQGLIFVENEGSPTIPQFSFVTDRYLNTFDVGTKSVICFADMDNDADDDMIVGSEKNPDGSLYYLENTGTTDNPEFTVRDTIYTGYENDLSLSPTVMDFDFDNDLDIIVGTFLGDVKLIENTGNFQNAQFTGAVDLLDGLGNKVKFSNYSRPLAINLDNDNDMDLVIGGFNGKLTAYLDTGEGNSSVFIEKPDIFEGVDLGDMSNITSSWYSGNGAGKDIIVGNRAGEVYLIPKTGIGSSTEFGTPELISDIPFEGREIAPAFYDIDKDGDDDLFLGSIRGGITFYENTQITGISSASHDIPGKYSLQTYPNPFNGGVNISISGVNEIRSIQIYDLLGGKIDEIRIEDSQSSYRWLPRMNISSGVYYVLVSLPNNSTLTEKVIYLK
ncbi:MAG: hypothetical protein SCALA702_12160 [Melioribacteraceae bacterium]|nr:MAG: hypothetical protein SCALA702_12160 [Melioribacteraceae bacterium]